MSAAIAHEGQARAVRRPRQAAAQPSIDDHSARLPLAQLVRDPDLRPVDPGDIACGMRNLRRMPCPEPARRLAVEVREPDLGRFGAHRRTGRVGRRAIHQMRSAHVDDRIACAIPSELPDSASVVPAVGGQATRGDRFNVASVCHPDIAAAGFVGHPRDEITSRRRLQIAGKRKIEDIPKEQFGLGTTAVCHGEINEMALRHREPAKTPGRGSQSSGRRSATTRAA